MAGTATVSGLFKVGGLGLLLLLRPTLVMSSVALAEWAALSGGARPRQAGLAALLAAPLVLAGAALRPQLLALPLFSAVLLLGGPRAERRWTPSG